ncbi:macro domain-containing protein, partial [Acinetobacter baumannii]|uniref:macro domain-containing protein n=2 Tax=Acinetobacter TaxID=469 RepID=UPI003AF47FC4
MKKVHLTQADITTFAVHAIVNSANKSLLGGSGLDYVIHKKAGPLMKAECIK